MPYFPGIGYGVANALSGLAGAELRRQYHEEEQTQKNRQLAVNEAAEARAKTATDQANLESQTKINALVSAAASKGELADFKAKAAKLGYPVVPADKVPTPEEQKKDEKAAGGGDQPAVKGGEQPAQDAPLTEEEANALWDKNTPLDQRTDFTDSGVEYTYGKGGDKALPHQGQQPGQRVRLETTGKVTPAKSSDGKTYGAPAAGGLSAKTTDAARQGKVAFSPTEGASYHASAEAEYERANTIMANRDSALKAIREKYSGNPQLLTFIEGNFKHSVQALYEESKANADKMKADGDAANFAQMGTMVAGKVLGHLAQGGVVDQKFYDANRELFEKTGLDPTMFAGLRMSGNVKGDNPLFKGMIINSQGMVFPQKAIALLANPALPWPQRVKGWDDVAKYAKMQLEARLAAQRIAQTDPLRVHLFYRDMALDAVRAQTEDDASLQTFMRNACRIPSGPDNKFEPLKPYKVTTEDGKVVTVTPPVIFSGWPQDDKDAKGQPIAGSGQAKLDRALDALANGNEEERKFYDHVLRPLHTRRWMNGTTAKIADAHYRMKAPGASAEELAYGKAYGQTTGQLEALSDWSGETP